MTNPYDEEYYLRGVASGRSNYDNYSWMPDQTLALALNLKRYLGLLPGRPVLDFGAARGYLVKALRMMGIPAWGYDISEWAVKNCDPEVAPYMNAPSGMCPYHYEWVIAKDCLEHISESDLSFILVRLLANTGNMFIIVPLAENSGGDYVSPKDRMDQTHVIRWTLSEWIIFLQLRCADRVVSGGYWVPGLKPEAYQHQKSCGFITMRRW